MDERRKILLRLYFLIIAVNALVFIPVLIYRSNYSFYSPKIIISWALILICFIGISSDAYGLFKLNSRDELFEFIYKEKVQKISEYLTIVGGALLFLLIL